MLGVKFLAWDILKHFSDFPQERGFHISCKLSPVETICMKCWILFSGKNIINLLSTELAQGVVKIKFAIIRPITACDMLYLQCCDICHGKEWSQYSWFRSNNNCHRIWLGDYFRKKPTAWSCKYSNLLFSIPYEKGVYSKTLLEYVDPFSEGDWCAGR